MLGAAQACAWWFDVDCHVNLGVLERCQCANLVSHHSDEDLCCEDNLNSIISIRTGRSNSFAPWWPGYLRGIPRLAILWYPIYSLITLGDVAYLALAIGPPIVIKEYNNGRRGHISGLD